MNVDQYFGVPSLNRQLAQEYGTRKTRHHFNTHVPTREEVETLGSEEVAVMLTGWMTHSATEIIPSRSQIHEVQQVLRTRPDAIQLSALIQICDSYVGDRDLPW